MLWRKRKQTRERDNEEHRHCILLRVKREDFSEKIYEQTPKRNERGNYVIVCGKLFQEGKSKSEVLEGRARWTPVTWGESEKNVRLWFYKKWGKPGHFRLSLIRKLGSWRGILYPGFPFLAFVLKKRIADICSCLLDVRHWCKSFTGIQSLNNLNNPIRKIDKTIHLQVRKYREFHKRYPVNKQQI